MNINEIIAYGAGFLESLPPVGGAFITLLTGWLAAKLMKFIVPKIFLLLRIDRFSEKTGIAGFLKKGNVQHSPSALAGILAFWFVMILALFSTVARLDEGLAESIDVWTRSALPKTIAAGLIVMIGVVLVTFIANFTVTIARNAAMRGAELLGRGIRYSGFIIVATMALDQLGLGRTIVSTLLMVLFAALAVGIALAFGLGCKDMARKYAEDLVKNLHERQRMRHGTDLEG